MNTTDVQLLKAREVGHLLSVSVRTVWRLAAEGQLPQPIRVTEKVTRWRLADLHEFVQKRRGTTRKNPPWLAGVKQKPCTNHTAI